MTANAMQEHREAYLAAGMNDYLSKPVDTVQLSEVLAAIVQRRGRPGGPPQVTGAPSPVPEGWDPVTAPGGEPRPQARALAR
jgi:two-component system sensor histidine kinase/response regulator